jgi:hypothetical protein
LSVSKRGAEQFFIKSPRTLDAVEGRYFQGIERIGDGLQMLVRQMQVDQSVFQSRMSEQDLNGTEVGARFEKVRSTTVSSMSLGT